MPPIVSVKHIVQHPDTAVVSNALLTHEVALGETAPGNSTTASVSVGSVVKAVYIERWITSLGAMPSNTQFVMILEKITGGSANPTVTNMLNLMSYPNKKNILFTTQGVLSGGQSVPLLRGWHKVPKGKQRFSIGDHLRITIHNLGNTIRVCGFEVYKEYQWWKHSI